MGNSWELIEKAYSLSNNRDQMIEIMDFLNDKVGFEIMDENKGDLVEADLFHEMEDSEEQKWFDEINMWRQIVTSYKSS